jgi:hypothetical protein
MLMGMPAADRFLNGVLQRSRTDILMNPLVMLLIIPGSLSFIVYYIYLIYEAWGIWFHFSANGEYLIALFLSVDISYIAYMMMKSTQLHIERDIVWTDSLTEYAAGYGMDASRLREMSDGILAQRITWARAVAFIPLVALGLMMVLSFFVLNFWDDSSFEIPELIVLSTAMGILFATTAFVHFKMYRVGDIQCRFTEEFKDVMDDEGITDTMVGKPHSHKFRIPIVLAIIAVILYLLMVFAVDLLKEQGIIAPQTHPAIIIGGIYLTLMFFYCVHVLNRHLRDQWAYEDKLLERIAEREGATGVETVYLEKGERPLDTWHIGSKAIYWAINAWRAIIEFIKFV